MEGNPEVGDEGRMEGMREEFLDDGEEVVEGTGFGEGGSVWGTGCSSCSSEEEGLLDESERDMTSE